MWRLIDQRIDAAHLPRARAARAAARAAAWEAGAAPATGDWLHIGIDATLVIDHSDDEDKAAPTWKKTYGHHRLLAFLDRPEIAGATDDFATHCRRAAVGSRSGTAVDWRVQDAVDTLNIGQAWYPGLAHASWVVLQPV
jgi:hypothetical protein